MAKTDSNQYPERLGVCMIINAPSALSYAWSIIKAFLDDVTKAKITQITERLDVSQQTSETEVGQLNLNEIGKISLRTAQAISADKYAENPSNGSFILIDEFSNSTVGVGFVD
jgi:sulfate adenylyltransferase subunit 1 (EFTu-like GTPase family)